VKEEDKGTENTRSKVKVKFSPDGGVAPPLGRSLDQGEVDEGEIGLIQPWNRGRKWPCFSRVQKSEVVAIWSS
jgi:hypothetical protein